MQCASISVRIVEQATVNKPKLDSKDRVFAGEEDAHRRAYGAVSGVDSCHTTLNHLLIPAGIGGYVLLFVGLLRGLPFEEVVEELEVGGCEGGEEEEDEEGGWEEEGECFL